MRGYTGELSSTRLAILTDTVDWRRGLTHMFDMRCRENGIDHRLIKIKHPWINGQVKRINRTIKEATVKRYHYDRHDEREAHLAGFINAYNYARRLKTPKRLAPYGVHLQNLKRRRKAMQLNRSITCRD